MSAPVNTHVPDVGDPVRIGGIVALGMEPGERWARIVGMLKQPPDPRFWNTAGGMTGARVIVRVFEPGDTDWPTGTYSRVAPGLGIAPIVGQRGREAAM